MLLKTCLLGALVGFSACQLQSLDDVKETRFLLGTVVEFTVSGVQEDIALDAIKQAVSAMQDIETKFTVQGNTSNTVQTFNDASIHQRIKLDASVDALLLESIRIHEMTDGAFDPTLGSLNQLWGFSGDTKPLKPPSKKAVHNHLARSGVQNIHSIQTQVWRKDVKGLSLDFGAIAKGLAIDEGIKVLKKMGVKHAIINAGGDMRILGAHGDKPWRIAIRHPRQQKPLGWLDVNKEISIVTSGDYERFYIYDKKRYHHIIDPKTGFPSMRSMSVTITAPNAMQADALSTAMFVLGYEQGMPMVERMLDVEAIWVDVNQKVHVSSGMKANFYFSQ